MAFEVKTRRLYHHRHSPAGHSTRPTSSHALAPARFATR